MVVERLGDWRGDESDLRSIFERQLQRARDRRLWLQLHICGDNSDRQSVAADSDDQHRRRIHQFLSGWQRDAYLERGQRQPMVAERLGDWRGDDSDLHSIGQRQLQRARDRRQWLQLHIRGDNSNGQSVAANDYYCYRQHHILCWWKRDADGSRGLLLSVV